jgi:hypothetical protein
MNLFMMDWMLENFFFFVVGITCLRLELERVKDYEVCLLQKVFYEVVLLEKKLVKKEEKRMNNLLTRFSDRILDWKDEPRDRKSNPIIVERNE